jgi:CRISPR-associated protein Csh1
MSLELIKNSICNSCFIQAKEQFNFRCALIKYFKGGKDNMADILEKVVKSLRAKVGGNITEKIETDEEYYFAIGQLASYLISLNKTNKKMHSLINPILNCKSDERLKQEIEKLFKKYNYTIQKGNKKFNNLFAMVLSYNPEEKIKSDILTAGYLYSNLIYEAKKDLEKEEEN